MDLILLVLKCYFLFFCYEVVILSYDGFYISLNFVDVMGFEYV